MLLPDWVAQNGLCYCQRCTLGRLGFREPKDSSESSLLGKKSRRGRLRPPERLARLRRFEQGGQAPVRAGVRRQEGEAAGGVQMPAELAAAPTASSPGGNAGGLFPIAIKVYGGLFPTPIQRHCCR